MIVPRKKAANPSAPRSPDILTLDNPMGWDIQEGSAVQQALKMSAVFRCVSYNSDTISIMPFYIMDSQTRERITQHPLLQMLKVRTNEVMSPTEYRRLMETWRLTLGNAYAYISRNARTGSAEELIPLHPDFVSIHKGDDGHYFYLYSDPSSGKVYRLEPCQLIHNKSFTLDGINGISPLRYAREVVAKDLAAKAYERSIYRNGGRPSGILYTDADISGYSDVEENGQKITKKELVRRSWEKVHGGSANAFRTAVLDNGLKYQAIDTISAIDAQFVESNDVSIADIARFFGTPLHVLMSGKQSYESNLQNRIEFVQTTALAAVTAFEDEDSYKLLSGSDQAKSLRIRRNMDAALRGDTANRAGFYKTMHSLGGYNVDEIRALEDLPAVPGGDVRMASLNNVPLEDFRRISLARNGKGGR